MREVRRMNTKQFHGIIKMIIAMIEKNVPKKDLLEYLGKLIE